MTGTAKRKRNCVVDADGFPLYDPDLFVDSPKAEMEDGWEATLQRVQRVQATRSGRISRAPPRYTGEEDVVLVKHSPAPKKSRQAIEDISGDHTASRTPRKRKQADINDDVPSLAGSPQPTVTSSKQPSHPTAVTPPSPAPPPHLPPVQTFLTMSSVEVATHILHLTDPYAILSCSGQLLTEASTEAEVRRAYLTLSVKIHPDKLVGMPEANEAFQGLVRAYEAASKAKAGPSPKAPKAKPSARNAATKESTTMPPPADDPERRRSPRRTPQTTSISEPNNADVGKQNGMPCTKSSDGHPKPAASPAPPVSIPSPPSSKPPPAVAKPPPDAAKPPPGPPATPPIIPILSPKLTSAPIAVPVPKPPAASVIDNKDIKPTSTTAPPQGDAPPVSNTVPAVISAANPSVVAPAAPTKVKLDIRGRQPARSPEETKTPDILKVQVVDPASEGNAKSCKAPAEASAAAQHAEVTKKIEVVAQVTPAAKKPAAKCSSSVTESKPKATTVTPNESKSAPKCELEDAQVAEKETSSNIAPSSPKLPPKEPSPPMPPLKKPKAVPASPTPASVPRRPAFSPAKSFKPPSLLTATSPSTSTAVPRQSSLALGMARGWCRVGLRKPKVPLHAK